MANVNRCNECSAPTLKELAWNKWLEIMHFINFLERQEVITANLAGEMSECMMSFKNYAEEENDRQHKEYYCGECKDKKKRRIK